MMDRQEEEEEEGEKRGRMCSLSSLPLDLTSEVLIRLPGKSVASSRCVSKHWSSCTTLACFNKSFTARSSQIPCLLILGLQSDKRLVGFSLPEQGNSDKSCSSSPVDSFLIKFPQNCYFIITSSVQGLYSFQGPSELVLWNPTIRRFSTLTKPESCWKNMTGSIGYDPIDGTYKALCMPYVTYPETRPKSSSNEPRVLTLGRGQESWRVIQGSFEHFPCRPAGLCINGVLYYESYLTSDWAEYCMMSFHVRSEKFEIIQVPWEECSRGKLLSYQGKLASVTCCSAAETVISLWVLEDAERHEWSFKRFTLPFPLDDPVLQRRLKLAGVTHGGEFVYVIHLSSRFHALYFDPQRNSFRRVVYEGIADDEFRRRSGLGNEPLRSMPTFPNHVETLMSV